MTQKLFYYNYPNVHIGETLTRLMRLSLQLIRLKEYEEDYLLSRCGLSTLDKNMFAKVMDSAVMLGLFEKVPGHRRYYLLESKS